MPRARTGQGSIPHGLGEELEQTLAAMAGMSPAAAETSIALLPFGDRVRLAAYAIISAAPDEAMAEAGWPTDFVLTSEGSNVIALCAQKWPRNTPDAQSARPGSDKEYQGQLDRIFATICESC